MFFSNLLDVFFSSIVLDKKENIHKVMNVHSCGIWG